MNETKQKILKLIFDLNVIGNQIEGYEKRIKYLENSLKDYYNQGIFIQKELLNLDNETLGLKVKQKGAEII